MMPSNTGNKTQAQTEFSSSRSHSSSHHLRTPSHEPFIEYTRTSGSQSDLLGGGAQEERMAWFTVRSESRMTPARRKALIFTYLYDWLVMIILIAVFFSLDKVPGFKREFSIDDPTLRFPYAEHERVPSVALYLIALVAPFVIQIIVNIFTIRSWWDFHTATLGLLFSLALTGAVTQFTKITVGRPRPDVISRCQPNSGVTNPEYGLVSVSICTQTDNDILKDGWRSFPSGHASLSFAGLGFLSFYLAGKVHLFNQKHYTTKAWLALAPLSGAALVGISRTMDYRHHWQDVFIGSILGLAMSYFSYRQYYPHLANSQCHRPFSPRIPRETTSAQNDIEAGSAAESNAPIFRAPEPPRRTISSHMSRGEGTGSKALTSGTEMYNGNNHSYSKYKDDESGRGHGRELSYGVELMQSRSSTGE